MQPFDPFVTAHATEVAGILVPCRSKAIASWLLCSPLQILLGRLPAATSYGEFLDPAWLTRLSIFY
jgi:hypothetical protein